MAAATSSTIMQDWQSYDFDNQTIEELKSMSQSDIGSRFGRRLKFGTAGLRAPMGVGSNRMNSLTVLQTTQGLCKYLAKEHSLDLDTMINVTENAPAVVIGFDGRYNSEKFAHVAASVFLSKKFKVYLFTIPTPTPLTPFMVTHFKCIAGIQVTASHNPKDDNGYKLYGSSGAQIVPPMDSDIEAHIEQELKPWEEALSCLNLQSDDIRLNNPDVVTLNPMSLVNAEGSTFSAEDMYLNMMVEELSMMKHLDSEGGESTYQPKFMYTAMHGVGWSLLSKLWSKFKLPSETLIPVKCQQFPDPEFSTVVFPNPEEKGALDIAVKEAKEAGDVDYVIANDPDADRFTAAEKLLDGSWKLFSGDELGILFADWQYLQFTKKNSSKNSSVDCNSDEGSMKDTALFITSVVSSRMLSKLASVRAGCVYKDTLTGFKFMSNESITTRQEHPNYVHLLAYEEAIGYQLSGSVPDKDGISAACVWADMTRYYRGNGKLISDHLIALQLELGLYITNNGYFICKDPNVIDEIFAEFRSNHYKLGEVICEDVNDVTLGVGSKNLPATPTNQMIQFIVNGVIATLRASGTEPKLKYYLEYAVEAGQDESSGRQVLEDTVELLTQQFYQPQKFDVRKG